MTKLTDQIALALRAQSVHQHVAPGNVDPHAYSLLDASVANSYRLSELLPKVPVSKEEKDIYATGIDARKSVNAISLQASIMEQSRVAQAGAHLIVVDPNMRPVPHTGGVVMYALEGSLRQVKPAPFAPVADGADVLTSAYPVAKGHYALEETASSAVRFELTRRQQKDMNPERMDFELMQSLALGIAHEMDRVLLEGIAAQPLKSFGIGAAAAKGLKFGDLRSFVGTTGTGGIVNAAGNLVANGVPAELTDTTPGTIVGAFATAGVAVLDDIRVIIERRDLQGTLQVTVFLNTMPVMADPTLFWKAA